MPSGEQAKMVHCQLDNLLAGAGDQINALVSRGFSGKTPQLLLGRCGAV